MRTLLSVPPTSRVGRYPKHMFQTRELPFTAQPFFIAPVLPAETLTNLYFEARVITDPILASIIGWKKEYYFFYVKVTDLLNDAIREMFVDPANTDLMATLGVANTQANYFTAKGAVPYLRLGVQRIWEHFFADDGEVFANNLVNDVPKVQIRDTLWLDSLTDKDDMPLGPDPDVATANDLEALMIAYEQLRAMGIADMTYEDFLRSYGIAIPAKDENKPELLARFSDFQYPSNTVNPADGVPTSAVSWVFKNGSREPKFFKEPGFIIGVSVTRPKVYFGGLAGGLVGFMSRAWDWSPNYLVEASSDPLPQVTLKRFGADTGPLGDRATATDAYWVDMRDLLIHGDMFQNVRPFTDNANPTDAFSNHLLALPPGNDHAKYKYLTEAQMKGFFVDAAGTSFWVRQDGYVSLAVKGRQVDYTQGNFAAA